jgi:hypothetical protein
VNVTVTVCSPPGATVPDQLPLKPAGQLMPVTVSVLLPSLNMSNDP